MVLCKYYNSSSSSTTSHFHSLCCSIFHHFSSSMMIFLLLLLVPTSNSISFNYPSFQVNDYDKIKCVNDSFLSQDKVLELTKNKVHSPLTGSVGRATYSEPLHLWDSKTRWLTDFSTHFSFEIEAVNQSMYGDGLSFFLAPNGSEVPPNSAGGFLGLLSNETALSNSTTNQIVAVEFDSFQNSWDPSSDHVGINVNSIKSVEIKEWTSSIKTGSTANAWVSYDSTTKNLSVFLTYAKNPVFDGNSSVYHVVDLREVLPEWVSVGFSAATGDCIETHTIISWNFSSTTPPPPPIEKNNSTNSTSTPSPIKKNNSREIDDQGKKKSKIGLVVGKVVGVGILGSGLGFVLFIWLKMRMTPTPSSGSSKEDDDDMNFDVSTMDDDFERGTGPKRFSYSELVRATGNFDEAGKLGEGGFGGVYRGFLSDLNLNIAVKRVSRGSKQGKKEYVSEVKVISRLRHRNLVQLIGWCHERNEFLLVYEFMPNRSLDSHLFRGKKVLTWEVRPSIRQVINVLNFESPLPNLPSKLPTPVYFVPLMHRCELALASSYGLTGSHTEGSQCYCSSCTTNWSQGTFGSTPSIIQGLYLKAWASFCKPKHQSGLGLRDLNLLNLSLISKLGWRLLTDVNSLWATILKEKYFPQCHPLNSKPKTNSSWFWKGICKGLEHINKYSVWEIRDGESVNIWDHNWIPNLPHLPTKPSNSISSSQFTIIKTPF
ncbi:Protein kinase domain [Macleaya cordata]|uniref:non-specific serine/threonine protein kinase n=1 Tax=Macleaya cordata TaxID=56857 RepID=A0A200RDW1_MACCD|nr:Protein kinase domain [Macleaya cordata]